MGRALHHNCGHPNKGYREEKRSSIVLFTIVILFFVCNAPRLLLNFYEFFTIEKLKDQCYTIPLWTMVLTSVSLLLMTINSSINFFVYCFANSAFREELYERVSQFSRSWFVNSMSDETAETTMIPMQEVCYLFKRGSTRARYCWATVC